MPEINANVVISNPRPIFTASRSFRALPNGRVYIGKVDTDPSLPGNQIPVYVENEDGTLVQVYQPLLINAAGKIVYNGQIVKVVAQQGHSMAVYDAYGSLEDYIPDILGYDPDQFSKKLASNAGAGLIGTSSGKTVQQEIDSLKSTYLSNYNGDLQLALNSSDTVLIDQDYILSSQITVGSGKSIKTINGAKITHAGGVLKTEVTGSPQYYKDVDGNRQIQLTAAAAEGDTTISLSDASSVQPGDKLILKNGYCDMWRVLEHGNNPRQAVNTLTYRTEIVSVISKSGSTLTISPLRYSYPLTPVKYGYIDQENALADYTGYTRPSATRMLYRDITIDVDVTIPSTTTTKMLDMVYVDGIKISARIKSDADISYLIHTKMSVVDINGVFIDGHKGSAVMAEETCVGKMTNLQAVNWRRGSDTPFGALNMSPVNASMVNVECSEKHFDCSGFYLNTSDGGVVSNVKTTNTGRCVDISFTRGAVVSDAYGANCDIVFGAYCSSNCTMSNGIANGYCELTSQSGDYKSALIFSQFTTDCKYVNIKRYSDKGYGAVILSDSINISVFSLSSPKTKMFTIIHDKASEIASGYQLAFVDGAEIGSFDRVSTYYDSQDEFGYSYPRVNYKSLRISNGGTVSLGGDFSQADSIELYSDATVTIGKNVLGIKITGFVNGMTCIASDKPSCFPDVMNLKMKNYPLSGVFNSVDSMMTNGSTFSTSFENGSMITDLYSRKQYRNASKRGEKPTWQGF